MDPSLASFAVAMGTLLVGGIVIRLLNLHMPRPRSAAECLKYMFWHPVNADKKRVRVNKTAWAVVASLAYAAMIWTRAHLK
jgi:hypothetical protein